MTPPGETRGEGQFPRFLSEIWIAPQIKILKQMTMQKISGGSL